jgi:hypothetical protein
MTSLKVLGAASVGLAIAMSAAPAAEAATAPPAPATISVSVPSNVQQVDTGITVHVDEVLNLSASGFASNGPAATRLGDNCTIGTTIYTEPTGAVRYGQANKNSVCTTVTTTTTVTTPIIRVQFVRTPVPHFVNIYGPPVTTTTTSTKKDTGITLTNAQVPTAKVGMLIGKIGSNGQWFTVGTGFSKKRLTSAGELYLAYNDAPANYAGAGRVGAYTVTLSDYTPPTTEQCLAATSATSSLNCGLSSALGQTDGDSTATSLLLNGLFGGHGLSLF